MTRVISEQTATKLAGDVMTDSVVAASRTTTMRDLATQMFLGGFSGVPITERDGRIVCLVTEFDIIRGIQAGRPIATTIAEVIMTRDVITVTRTRHWKKWWIFSSGSGSSACRSRSGGSSSGLSPVRTCCAISSSRTL